MRGAPGATVLNDVAVARQPVWRLDGLSDPESVALAADGRTLNVANVAGEGGARAATVLATGLGQADGVARADGDNYLVGEWSGRLFYVSPDGQSRTKLDSRAGGDYINDFIKVGDLLIVPNWKPGSVTAYRMMTWMLTEAAPESLPLRLQRALM